MSKRSSTAWKAARAAATPPIPICPNDLSEPKLAVLLFTKACTVCGKSPTHCQYVWYTLRLRACKPCFQSSVIWGRAAAQQYKYLDDFGTVLEILPGESMWQRSQRRVSPSDDYYLVEDLRQMSEIVEQYQFQFEARVEGARQEFEQFIERTKSEASERIESAHVLRKWSENSIKLCSAAEYELKQARRQEIISKLVESGHDIRDAQQAPLVYSRIPNLFWSKEPLTAAAWKRIKPKAERFVEELNRQRLEREEDPIKGSRRSAFRERYSTFKSSYDEFPKTLVPSERFFFKTHEGIKDAIEAEGTSTFSTLLDDAFSELPDYLNKWRNEQKIKLTRIVLESRTGSGIVVDLQTAEEQAVLSLATSVFATCGYGHSFTHDDDTVHWIDSIGEHIGKKFFHTPWRKSAMPYEETQCIRVLPNLVDHIKMLVQAVGLDPDTSTIEDMDKVNARFYCDDCSFLAPSTELFARNWRNCVSHIGFHSKSKPWKGWTLLSPEDRAVVDEHEKRMETDGTSASQWNSSAVSLNGKRVGPRGNLVGRTKIMRCYRGRPSRID